MTRYSRDRTTNLDSVLALLTSATTALMLMSQSIDTIVFRPTLMPPCRTCSPARSSPR